MGMCVCAFDAAFIPQHPRTMSTREIIAELPRLTLAELHAVEQRIAELTSRQQTSAAAGLRVERIAGRLVLTGPQIVRQAEVEAILDEFP